MKTNNANTKTLVLGGTGKTGSRVVRRLQQSGLSVRIGSRNAEIPFDWENPSTWDAVLQDIDTAYITFQPDLAVPGAIEAIELFSAKAVKNNVKKLVLLSGRGEPEAEACEQIVMKAGVDWAVVRASWFCQNFSETHMLEPILAGYVSLPVGNVREPFIDVDDIADVVAMVLMDDKYNGEVYEVTGPRAITFQEAMEEISIQTGRAIQFSQISNIEYEAMLNMHGVPNEIITLFTYLFTEVLDGRNVHVVNGVEQVLGRKATDFSEYVRKTAATGIWNQEIVVS